MTLVDLQEAIRYGIIDPSVVGAEIENMKKKQYLEKHTQKIWVGSNGRYMTYLNVGGKRKLISKRTEEELHQIISEFYRDLEEPNIEKIFYGWLDGKREYGEITPQTYDKYETTFYRCMKDVKDERITDFDEVRLEGYIKEKIRELDMTYKAWSDWRILLYGIFRYAHKRKMTDIVIRDFMDDLQLSPKTFKQRIFQDNEEVFTDKEVDSILAHIMGEKITRTELGIILAFQTGLRASEIIVLNKEDIDFKERILTVNKTEVHYKEDGKTRYHVQHHTKGRDGWRQVYLSDGAIKTLQVLCNLSEDGKSLFYTHAGAMTDRLYRICGKLNITKRSLHKCRKTYATRLINAEVPDILVAKMLGHTNTATTYKHYVFNNREREEEKSLILRAI